MRKTNSKLASILVVGDAILDCYVSGKLKKVDKDCDPVIFTLESINYYLGGAANVCATIRSLGFNVSLASYIGNDENGTIMLNLLNEKNISLDHLIVCDNFKTVTKTRLSDKNESQVLRIDDEKNDQSGDMAQSIFQSIKRVISKYDVIVLSDYNKGSITEESIRQIINLANEYSKKVIVDSKSNSISKYNNSYMIKADFKQFCHYCFNDGLLSNCKIDIPYIIGHSEQILEALNINHLLVTCAAEGMVYLKKGAPCYYEKALVRNNLCAIGSGDVVMAIISACVAYDIGIKESISLANNIAGNLVAYKGTSNVSLSDIREYILAIKSNKKVLDNLSSLILLKTYYSNIKIVFTNGCFDWLHEGHIDFLEKAASLGDILVVALNDDDSIKKLKGQDRPVCSLSKRICDLAELPFVDFIIPFSSESNLAQIIKILCPSVLVKGSEYRNKEITGGEFVKSIGGKMIFIEHTYDVSTTKKLKDLII